MLMPGIHLWDDGAKVELTGKGGDDIQNTE
jgi:hypothetical protein